MPLNRLHAMVERFNLDLIGIEPPDRPTLLGFERGEFRLGHLREELAEVESALSDEDLEGTVDGLLDLVYVALGALVEMGVPAGAAFEEVHRANMARKRGEKSTRPGSLGFDAVKPDGWTPPNLEPYLAMTRDDVMYVRDQKELADAYTGGEIDEDEVKLDRSTQYPKILVMGYARHGKDTVAEYLATKYGLSFTSSSLFCAERVMMPYFNTFKDSPIYSSVAECFADRHNNRQEWYEAIREFNWPDATSLGRAIFEEHDIYCGLRSKAEFNALKNAGVFDVCIWVDRSDVLLAEGKSSCTVGSWMADFVLDNNGTLDELGTNIDQLMENILP